MSGALETFPEGKRAILEEEQILSALNLEAKLNYCTNMETMLNELNVFREMEMSILAEEQKVKQLVNSYLECNCREKARRGENAGSGGDTRREYVLYELSREHQN